MKIIWTWGLGWRWDSTECLWRSRTKYASPKQTACGISMSAKGKLLLGSFGMRFSFKFWVLFELQSWSKSQHGVGGGESFSCSSSPLYLSKGRACICTEFLVHMNSYQKTWSMGLHTTSQTRVGLLGLWIVSLQCCFTPWSVDVDVARYLYLRNNVGCHVGVWMKVMQGDRVSKGWDPWVIYILPNNKGLGSTLGLKGIDLECPPHKGRPHLEHIPYAVCIASYPPAHMLPLWPQDITTVLCVLAKLNCLK